MQNQLLELMKEVEGVDTRLRKSSTISSAPADLSPLSSTLMACRQQPLKTIDDLAALDKLDEVNYFSFLNIILLPSELVCFCSQFSLWNPTM